MALTPPGVAILNTVLARQLWPDGDAIGRRLQVLDQGGRLVTVVGIVQPTTQQFPGERPQPAIFFPYEQQPRGQMVLLAHTDGPSASVLDALRAVARRPDPSVPVFDAQTIERFYHVLVDGAVRDRGADDRRHRPDGHGADDGRACTGWCRTP